MRIQKLRILWQFFSFFGFVDLSKLSRLGLVWLISQYQPSCLDFWRGNLSIWLFLAMSWVCRVFQPCAELTDWSILNFIYSYSFLSKIPLNYFISEPLELINWNIKVTWWIHVPWRHQDILLFQCYNQLSFSFLRKISCLFLEFYVSYYAIFSMMLITHCRGITLLTTSEDRKIGKSTPT